MDVKDSKVAFAGEGESHATAKTVAGTLMKGDAVESRFTAEGGDADTSTGTLVLVGDVRITSERDDIVLRAKRVTYEKATALIRAEGTVMVTSAAWESGPFPVLVATPGLERIGTPDRFES